MPQASDEDRAKMAAYFPDGDGIDLAAPLEFLMQNGWCDRDGWLWTSKRRDQITEKEFDCVAFLCDEWDFVA
jgi:hypothetical protein